MRALPNEIANSDNLCFVRSTIRILGAADIDVEFTDFAVGQTFPNATLPRTITSDGVDVQLTKFNNSSGANGRIVDAQLFGVPNNALFLAANLGRKFCCQAHRRAASSIFAIKVERICSRLTARH